MILLFLRITMNHKNINQASSKSALGYLVAAATTAVASSLCCIAPLIYLVFGVSAAGLSGLSQLAWLQWPMMIISIIFLGLITYKLFFSKRPLCSGVIQRKHLIVLYCLLLPFIIFMLTYPFVLPWVLELFE